MSAFKNLSFEFCYRRVCFGKILFLSGVSFVVVPGKGLHFFLH